MFKYLIGFAAAVFIIPALLPSTYVVERTTTINQSANTVYSELVNLEGWREWSPWIEKEPTAEQSFDGIPGVVGSSVAWDGEIIGSGKQTLTTLNEPTYLEMDLELYDPNPSRSIAYFKIDENSLGVEVTWGVKGSLSYPIERVVGLFMEQLIAPDFERGLERLKERLERPTQ